MKKNIIYILTCLLAFPLFQSCEDFLDEENLREPVADVYYINAAGYND